jgi:tRNA(Ile)-lysidine synthase
VPLMKRINPSLETTVFNNSRFLSDALQLLEAGYKKYEAEIVYTDASMLCVDFDKLNQLQYPGLFLYEMLNPYGFSSDQLSKLAVSLNYRTGKKFFSATHTVFIDRGRLMLMQGKPFKQSQSVTISGNESTVSFLDHSYGLSKISVAEIQNVKDLLHAYVDLDKVTFPLQFRIWKNGDWFYPYGLKGKKKLSDFLTELKLNMEEKSRQAVLLSGKDIVWVAGLRIDDRYKITSDTKSVFHLQIIELHEIY